MKSLWSYLKLLLICLLELSFGFDQSLPHGKPIGKSPYYRSFNHNANCRVVKDSIDPKAMHIIWTQPFPPGGRGEHFHRFAIWWCAALQGQFWKVSFFKIGCDLIKFPWNRVWFRSPNRFGYLGLWHFPEYRVCFQSLDHFGCSGLWNFTYNMVCFWSADCFGCPGLWDFP